MPPCPEVKGEAPGHAGDTKRVVESSEGLAGVGGGVRGEEEGKSVPCGKAKLWS